MHLVWMALSCYAIGQLGYLATVRFENRLTAGCVAMIVLVMIFARGFYWHIFETGEGFFTLNRVTAALLLFAAYMVGSFQGARYGMARRMADD